MPPDNNQPWWSKSVWQLGPLAVIAMVLLLVQIGVIPSTTSTTLADVKAGVATMQVAVEAHAAESRNQTKLLRAICLGVARSPDAAARCVE